MSLPARHSRSNRTATISVPLRSTIVDSGLATSRGDSSQIAENASPVSTHIQPENR